MATWKLNFVSKHPKVWWDLTGCLQLFETYLAHFMSQMTWIFIINQCFDWYQTFDHRAAPSKVHVFRVFFMHTGLIGTKMCKKFQKNNNILHLLAKIGSTVKQEFARFCTILPGVGRRAAMAIAGCPQIENNFSKLEILQHFDQIVSKKRNLRFFFPYKSYHWWGASR